MMQSIPVTEARACDSELSQMVADLLLSECGAELCASRAGCTGGFLQASTHRAFSLYYRVSSSTMLPGSSPVHY